MKSIVFSFIIFFLTPLHADWKQISDDNEKIYFIETDMVIPHLEGRRMAKELHEYKVPLDDGTTSLRIRSDYNCKEKKVRYLTFDKIAGEMGVGKIVFTQDRPSVWTSVSSNSPRKKILEFVCKR